MKDPKYPHDLSMISEIDSASLPEEKDRESHIMSVSKSFCGATAALMAADGNFVKVASWYDNEWAFSMRMLDITSLISKL